MKPDNNPAKSIKIILAGLIGVEPEDIKDEDYLDEDLHMDPAEVVDFLQKLQEQGFDTASDEKINELSVSEIAELLAAHAV
jgi:hypothetical protein